MLDVKTFETLYDLTSHPGWKVITDDLEIKVETIKEAAVRITQADPSLYSLGVGHGIVKCYREFLTLREMLEMQLKDNEEQALEADDV